MKNILIILASTLRLAVIACALSALFCGVQWLISLTSICGAPTLYGFLGGALALFLLLFVMTIRKVVITMKRQSQDPVFRDVNEKIGLSWEEYQRFKNEKNKK